MTHNEEEDRFVLESSESEGKFVAYRTLRYLDIHAYAYIDVEIIFDQPYKDGHDTCQGVVGAVI
jgi:hypothetical protein